MFARIFLPTMLAATMLGSCTGVLAANPQGASGQGKAWEPSAKLWRARTAGNRISHARDYVRGVQRYSVQSPKIIPTIGPEHVEEVGRNITSAKKDLEAVKKASAEDKDILTRVAAIEKHLDAAAEQQKMMQDCCKEGTDGKEMMGCCESCMKHLDAAHKEHEALMKKVDPEPEKSEKVSK